VVHTPNELEAQVRVLKSGCHGWNTSGRGIYAERFVKGREFTTLIVGSSKRRHEAVIFKPVERIFHASLPEHERFLTFDRIWEFYESETPLADQAPLYDFAPVCDDALSLKIEELSFKAYESAQGSGYTRVDLRLDQESDELYVLEVNAQCGLSEDENFTDIGAILRFEKRSFSELLMLIMLEAVRESK
jgi:D-alanine-D-alanine ligase